MSMMIRRRKQIMEKRVSERGTRSLSEVSSEDTRPLTSDEPTYKKTDIARMGKSALVDLAKKNGVANAEGMSGNGLKAILMDKLGL